MLSLFRIPGSLLHTVCRVGVRQPPLDAATVHRSILIPTANSPTVSRAEEGPAHIFDAAHYLFITIVFSVAPCGLWIAHRIPLPVALVLKGWRQGGERQLEARRV